MNFLYRLILACSFAFIVTGSLKAQQNPWSFIIGSNFEFGGDRIAEIYFTNGNTQSVRAGQGGHFYAGTQYVFPGAEKFGIRGTIGIKYVTTAADNAHIRLTRIPIQFTANVFPTRKLRFAAGISMHTGIKYKADGIMENLSFNGASGPVFEIAYGGFGLTYTAMKYKNVEYGDVYSANSFGISLSTPVRRLKRGR